MENNGQHDSLHVIPTLFPWWLRSACVLITHELWVIPRTLFSFSHLFNEIVTNKFSVELITRSPASGSPEAEAKMEISARDVLEACMRAQLCLTVCGPLDCSLPGLSVPGILQARIMEWVAISFSMVSSWLRDWTHISYVFCIDRQVFNHWGAWEACARRLLSEVRETGWGREKSELRLWSHKQSSLSPVPWESSGIWITTSTAYPPGGQLSDPCASQPVEWATY